MNHCYACGKEDVPLVLRITVSNQKSEVLDEAFVCTLCRSDARRDLDRHFGLAIGD